jgi:hypothetical protein
MCHNELLYSDLLEGLLSLEGIQYSYDGIFYEAAKPGGKQQWSGRKLEANSE